MIFAELKIFGRTTTTRLDNTSVLCNIVPHDLARKIMLSLPVRNCTIFAQECVEDRIFLLMWLMLMFHFCVSTVSTVERVINKTKPSSM